MSEAVTVNRGPLTPSSAYIPPTPPLRIPPLDLFTFAFSSPFKSGSDFREDWENNRLIGGRGNGGDGVGDGRVRIGEEELRKKRGVKGFGEVDLARNVIDPDRKIMVDGKTGSFLTHSNLKSLSIQFANTLSSPPFNIHPTPYFPPNPSSSSNPTPDRKDNIYHDSDPRPHLRRLSQGDEIISSTVLVVLPNCLSFGVVVWGILAAGGTVSMASPALTPLEISHILSLSTPSMIITLSSNLNTISKALEILKKSLTSNETSDDQKRDIEELLKRFVGNGDAAITVDQIKKGGRIMTVQGGWDYFANVNNSNNKDHPLNPPPPASPSTDWTHHLLSSPPSPSPPTAPFSLPSLSTAASSYRPDDSSRRTAFILWSSGTSGKSKGVLISHYSMVAAGGFCFGSQGYESGDRGERFIATPPFYHVFGLCQLILFAPCIGATLYVFDKFDPKAYLEAAQKYKATHLHIAPPIAVLLAKSPEVTRYDLSSISGATCGGAPLGVGIIKDVYNRLGIMIKMGFGTSETAGNTSQRATNWKELEPALGSSGIPGPGTELMIVGIEGEKAGKVLNIEEEGELLIRTPSEMIGYLKNPKVTEETIDKDGWVHSGDIGKIDKNGNLFLVDRLKEMIKVKGFQVSPADLEGLLCTSNLIADAGVSHIHHADRATDLPRAWVVPTDKKMLQEVLTKGKVTKEAIELAGEIKKLTEGHLAPYKWLKGGLVFIETVPKSPSGKILRRLLKDTKGVEIPIYDQKAKL